MNDDNSLTQWVIYDHPADYPEHFVVRPWEVRAGGKVEPRAIYLFKSIEGARAMLAPLGLYCLDRHPEDDPTIVEVWL